MSRRAIDPAELAPPVGFAHGTAASRARATSSRSSTARRAFGEVWRRHCGRHYPGMAMFQVVSLFDPEARIEIQGIAAQ